MACSDIFFLEIEPAHPTDTPCARTRSLRVPGGLPASRRKISRTKLRPRKALVEPSINNGLRLIHARQCRLGATLTTIIMYVMTGCLRLVFSLRLRQPAATQPSGDAAFACLVAKRSDACHLLSFGKSMHRVAFARDGADGTVPHGSSNCIHDLVLAALTIDLEQIY